MNRFRLAVVTAGLGIVMLTQPTGMSGLAAGQWPAACGLPGSGRMESRAGMYQRHRPGALFGYAG